MVWWTGCLWLAEPCLFVISWSSTVFGDLNQVLVCLCIKLVCSLLHKNSTYEGSLKSNLILHATYILINKNSTTLITKIKYRQFPSYNGLTYDFFTIVQKWCAFSRTVLQVSFNHSVILFFTFIVITFSLSAFYCQISFVLEDFAQCYANINILSTFKTG